MELRGWNYTGRNLSSDFHNQFRLMVDYLSDPNLVAGRSWCGELQDDVAKAIGTKSSGVVRTIKTMCELFGLINPSELKSNVVPTKDTLLSDRGRLVHQAATLEHIVATDTSLEEDVIEKAVKEIKHLYEEAYCDALLHYFIKNDDGSLFSPLRETQRALNKYKMLDKWEWYLLNTLVRHNDNPSEFELFEKYVSDYREGKYSFTMANVVEKKKGHQYIPQYYEYAGLYTVTQYPWSIKDNGTRLDFKQFVLSDEYLKYMEV